MTTPQQPTTPQPSTAQRPSPATVHAVLVHGFWLGSWAWDGVVPILRDAGIEPRALTLPGMDPDAPQPDVTLDDHVDAVLDAVHACDGPVVLVAHSGGAVVAQVAVDREPDAVRRVVYVDGGPLLPGMALAEPGAGDLPLPSWDELAAALTSAEGLDDAARADFRARAVPQPGAVARAVIDVRDPRRLAVPTTFVCTSLPSPVLQQMAATGKMPTELLALTDVRFVDLPTGHWPMLSRPADLGRVLVEEMRDL